MKIFYAIKIIAAYALFIWATASFADVSMQKGGVALRAAGVPVAGVAIAGEPVTVTGGWVRSTAAGQKGSGAFMKITAKEGLRLTGVSSPVAGVVEVHEMKIEGDIMRMRAVPVLELPAGIAVELKPGGYHLMLMDLRQGLAVGSTVPVSLMLKDAKGGERRVEVRLPVLATAPSNGAAKPGIAGPGK